MFELTATTNLKLGIKQTTASSYYWTFFDNFRLYYYGPVTKNHVTDIDSVETDAKQNAASTSVYNLYGQKVGESLENLPRGIYIQGGKKIYVK
jgi:hypothetical protein